MYEQILYIKQSNSSNVSKMADNTIHITPKITSNKRLTLTLCFVSF